MENKGNKLNFTIDDIKSNYKDFRDFYVNHLKNNPFEIKHYKEQLVTEEKILTKQRMCQHF